MTASLKLFPRTRAISEPARRLLQVIFYLTHKEYYYYLQLNPFQHEIKKKSEKGYEIISKGDNCAD